MTNTNTAHRPLKHLYIIGNGFDRHHGAESTYFHFREYLIRRNPEIVDTFEMFFGDGNLFSKWSFNALWADFEQNLSELDRQKVFDYIDLMLPEVDEGMANKYGRAIRFHESTVREMGRMATGVRGMTLDEGVDDEVVGMICLNSKNENESILVISEKGYGKRSNIDDYRITNRGGKGVKTLNLTDKTGKLVDIKNVTDENDLVIINRSGITIRLKVADIRVMGRATQGVTLINLEKRNDEIASVCKVLSDTIEENSSDEEITEIAE